MNEKVHETKYPADWTEERKKLYEEYCDLDELAEGGCFMGQPEGVDFEKMPKYNLRSISERMRKLGRRLTEEEVEEFRVK